jgi:AmiR/NasT family two-component response regulator
MKSEVYKIMAHPLKKKLLARILDVSARIKKREGELRRTTRDLSTRVAKYAEADGGIFEYLF